MIDRRFVATVLVILSLVTLISGAYAIYPWPPPPKQAFDGSGFVYTVEYECGYLEGDYYSMLAGTYRTAIMVHNPTDRNQTFVMKFFMLLTSGEKNLPPVWSDAYVIMPDGAADIDCEDISETFRTGLDYFMKGLVIISHPLSLKGVLLGPKVPLDVIATYTYATDAGASKDVVLVPGVYVSKVPMPPITPPT